MQILGSNDDIPVELMTADCNGDDDSFASRSEEIKSDRASGVDGPTTTTVVACAGSAAGEFAPSVSAHLTSERSRCRRCVFARAC